MVERFGFVTIIKPAKCLEVDSVYVFTGIATFPGILEINAFFLFNSKNPFFNSTDLNDEELDSCHRRSYPSLLCEH